MDMLMSPYAHPSSPSFTPLKRRQSGDACLMFADIFQLILADTNMAYHDGLLADVDIKYNAFQNIDIHWIK